MNNKNIKVKEIIPKCGADSVVPFVLMFIFYLILHGHLSPGGGFQGGVLVIGVVVLLYLGYGIKGLTAAFNEHRLHKLEAVGSIFYVAFAMLGVAYGANFCMNVFAGYGNIGDILSSGTIFLMNAAVGEKVFTGVAAMGITMLCLLVTDEEKE